MGETDCVIRSAAEQGRDDAFAEESAVTFELPSLAKNEPLAQVRRSVGPQNVPRLFQRAVFTQVIAVQEVSGVVSPLLRHRKSRGAFGDPGPKLIGQADPLVAQNQCASRCSATSWR